MSRYIWHGEPASYLAGSTCGRCGRTIGFGERIDFGYDTSTAVRHSDCEATTGASPEGWEVEPWPGVDRGEG